MKRYIKDLPQEDYPIIFGWFFDTILPALSENTSGENAERIIYSVLLRAKPPVEKLYASCYVLILNAKNIVFAHWDLHKLKHLDIENTKKDLLITVEIMRYIGAFRVFENALAAKKNLEDFRKLLNKSYKKSWYEPFFELPSVSLMNHIVEWLRSKNSTVFIDKYFYTSEANVNNIHDSFLQVLIKSDDLFPQLKKIYKKYEKEHERIRNDFFNCLRSIIIYLFFCYTSYFFIKNVPHSYINMQKNLLLYKNFAFFIIIIPLYSYFQSCGMFLQNLQRDLQ